MIEGLTWVHLLLGVSLVIYFAFDFLDRGTVLDERERLIRLKAMELTVKLTIATLTASALVILLFPFLPAVYPLMALVLACLYGEIAGKVYYRRKL